ncbi:uncharacterized protein (DUF58 family) [Paenibacillus sp. DS2015]|uniref:DUF58 domain-containing protein n=1 Tax=Paenibacillus sp. DS2015 TaxID=3373917 RepID=UPI003D23E2FA
MAVLWLCLSAVLIAVLQGLIFGVSALRKINYTRVLSLDRCFAGDSFEMVETISNSKSIPVLWLRLEAMLPASFRFQSVETGEVSQGNIYQNHRSLFTLKPYYRITRRHPVTALQRGIYAQETVVMTGGDLLGIYNSSRLLPVHLSLIVYPSLLELNELPPSYRTWQGELEVSRFVVEDPFLITGTREYTGQEPMNRIHWKASARSGALQVYKQGYSSDPEVFICVNVQVSPNMWNVVSNPEMVEWALSYAATAAVWVTDRGMKVGFGHNGHTESTKDSYDSIRMIPAGGQPHLEDLLQAMAEVQMKCKKPFEQYLMEELERDCEDRWDYLLITAFVSSQMEERIELLRSRGHSITILPIEIDGAYGQYKEEQHASSTNAFSTDDLR